jgi:hypothetical protein
MLKNGTSISHEAFSHFWNALASISLKMKANPKSTVQKSTKPGAKTRPTSPNAPRDINSTKKTTNTKPTTANSKPDEKKSTPQPNSNKTKKQPESTKATDVTEFLETYGDLSKKKRKNMVDEFGSLIVRPIPELNYNIEIIPFDPEKIDHKNKCTKKAQQWISHQKNSRPAYRKKYVLICLKRKY